MCETGERMRKKKSTNLLKQLVALLLGLEGWVGVGEQGIRGSRYKACGMHQTQPRSSNHVHVNRNRGLEGGDKSGTMTPLPQTSRLSVTPLPHRTNLPVGALVDLVALEQAPESLGVLADLQRARGRAGRRNAVLNKKYSPVRLHHTHTSSRCGSCSARQGRGPMSRLVAMNM